MEEKCDDILQEIGVSEDEICPLYLGGHCPMCDNDWETYGFSSLREGRKANRDCCKYHMPATEKLYDKLRELDKQKQEEQ